MGATPTDPTISMHASRLVKQLLEDYDIDDPLDRNDPAFYPEGFEARRDNGDRRVFKLSLRDSTDKKAVYSMTVYWIDEYTGQERDLKTAIWYRIDPEKVDARLKAEAARWQAAGWSIRFL